MSAFEPFAPRSMTSLMHGAHKTAAHPRQEISQMTVKKPEKNAANDDEPVVIQTKPGHHKDIGGGESENWNFRQMQLILSALPGASARDKKSAGEVGSAVISGLMDVKPTDPV